MKVSLPLLSPYLSWKAWCSLCLALGLSACVLEEARQTVHQQEVRQGIRIFSKNPRYWSYRGEPVLLMGGSREDNLFQIADLEQHLDSVQAAGGNYVRNTLSSRDSTNRWPYVQLESGAYDLERLDTIYFSRLERLLRLTAERNMIVQLELWDRFDFAREPWLFNPYRPANNVNYDTLQSGLADAYPRHPNFNDNPFFRSIPALDSNLLVLNYQHHYIDSVLTLAFAYDHVLYCMDNETSGAPAWGSYWAQYIRTRAERVGKTVYYTEMWDAWDLKNEQHLATLDYPDLYGFVDVSQNNHTSGQEHWDNLQWVRNYTRGQPRPLNNVKIYGSPDSIYGSERDALERFWRSVIGGAAAVRFHRPPTGLGMASPVPTHLNAVQILISVFDLFRSQPDGSSSRLREREPNEAYLSYLPGEQYALYFPNGGSVQLDLRNVAASGHVYWLDPTAQTRLRRVAQPISGGDWRTLTAPADGHWLAVVKFLEEEAENVAN